LHCPQVQLPAASHCIFTSSIPNACCMHDRAGIGPEAIDRGSTASTLAACFLAAAHGSQAGTGSGLTNPRFPALQILLIARQISSPAAPKLCSASSACMHAVQCKLARPGKRRNRSLQNSPFPQVVLSIVSARSLQHSAASGRPSDHRRRRPRRPLSCSGHTA